ncbi:MAG TPA: hypothetical protein VMF64_06720 [Steroidobacteraceae bacterium]|nr:hypothetical protein [Steroidobacteraceae bacterium]
MSFGKLVSLTATALLLSTPWISAQAGNWQASHPRRAEVNARLANQNRRIHADVRHGTLTHSQAHALHRDDHAIRQEERDMAHQNGSHISKPEQRVLNGQENAVSHDIPPR